MGCWCVGLGPRNVLSKYSGSNFISELRWRCAIQNDKRSDDDVAFQCCERSSEQCDLMQTICELLMSAFKKPIHVCSLIGTPHAAVSAFFDTLAPGAMCRNRETTSRKIRRKFKVINDFTQKGWAHLHVEQDYPLMARNRHCLSEDFSHSARLPASMERGCCYGGIGAAATTGGAYE